MTTNLDLSREIEAAKVLREQVAALTAGDEDFIRDAIEGETSLHEIISALVANEGEDKSLLEGLDRYGEALSNRKERIKHRIETRRALIASGLEIAGLKSLETPTGTAALTKVAPKAIIQEEAEIPTEFWKVGKPSLDKKALNDALKAGRIIPGATLSNGGMTTTIRRS